MSDMQFKSAKHFPQFDTKLFHRNMIIQGIQVQLSCNYHY